MASPPRPKRSLAERAIEQLAEAVPALAGLLRESKVEPAVSPSVTRHALPRSNHWLEEFHPGPRRGVAVFEPGRRAHIRPPKAPERFVEWQRAKETISQWTPVLKAIGAVAPPHLAGQIVQRADQLLEWAELASGEATAVRISSAKDNADEVLRLLADIRALIGQVGDFLPPLRFARVVDTSALMDCPKPREYGSGEFDLVIPRTVLRELDELRHHQQEAKRNKARRALIQVKEWERRGSLIDGVKEDGSIRIRVLGREADMTAAPPDLDSSKPDDRILWAARELTFEKPTSVVVLVSGDSNLRTRAALERIETEAAPLSNQ